LNERALGSDADVNKLARRSGPVQCERAARPRPTSAWRLRDQLFVQSWVNRISLGAQGPYRPGFAGFALIGSRVVSVDEVD
jgi:hypothetical protein